MTVLQLTSGNIQNHNLWYYRRNEQVFINASDHIIENRIYHSVFLLTLILENVNIIW